MRRLPVTRSCCDQHTRRAPGCRSCLDRAARWQKQYEYERQHGLLRKVPSSPYVEMVGRLGANGWPGYIIANKVGWRSPYFTWTSVSRRVNISIDLAERIERATFELRDFPGPSTITRARAIAAGFTPYIDDPVDGEPVIDWVVIDRAMKGDRTALDSLSFAEKDAAIRAGLDRGWLPNQVSVRLAANIERVRRVQRGEKRGPGGPKKKQAA